MDSQQSFDERKGLLRFQVLVGQEPVTAFISSNTWQAGYGPFTSDASLLDLYRENLLTINAIVSKKVRTGARKPVVLSARDLEV